MSNVLTNEQIGGMLGNQPGAGIKPENDVLTKIQDIVQNLRFVFEAVMQKRQQAMQQQQQPVAQIPYKRMESPEVLKRMEIDEKKLKSLIRSKIKLVKYLPDEFKNKSLIDLANQYQKEPEQAEPVIINFIKQIIKEVVS